MLIEAQLFFLHRSRFEWSSIEAALLVIFAQRVLGSEVGRIRR